MQNSLVEYNWNEETGQILNLPKFDNLSKFLLKYNSYKELKLKTIESQINYDIEHLICLGFENIISHFKTKKLEITLYNFNYKLSNENSNFFLENSLNNIFYIRPMQLISIFENVLSYIFNSFFQDSLPIKEISEEESEYYFDLLIKDEIKAEEYRRQFFTSLQKDSSKEILEICNLKILEAFKFAFESKISKINYNGDENLKSEIIYFIDNNIDFQNIVRL